MPALEGFSADRLALIESREDREHGRQLRLAGLQCSLDTVKHALLACGQAHPSSHPHCNPGTVTIPVRKIPPTRLDQRQTTSAPPRQLSRTAVPRRMAL
jgi:hypothetical protein